MHTFLSSITVHQINSLNLFDMLDFAKQGTAYEKYDLHLITEIRSVHLKNNMFVQYHC